MRPLLEELRTRQANLRRVAARKAQSAKLADLPAVESYRAAVATLAETLGGSNCDAVCTRWHSLGAAFAQLAWTNATADSRYLASGHARNDPTFPRLRRVFHAGAVPHPCCFRLSVMVLATCRAVAIHSCAVVPEATRSAPVACGVYDCSGRAAVATPT